MGMAASQARYLGLTARKTNVEYEGQQVNQQRVALANQSAGLFQQLMSLTVPVPPSTEAFTTVQYTYNNGTDTETITNISPLTPTDPLYNYTVTHNHTASVYTGIETKTANPQVKMGGTPADYNYVGNSVLTKYDPLNTDQAAAIAQIKASLPKSNIAAATDADIYTFQSGGASFFACKADLKASYDSTGGKIDNQINLNKYNAAYLDTTVTQTEKARLTQNASGRFTSAKLENSSATYDLTSVTKTDESGYNNAMNQYNYNTAKYQKQVEDINAKTRIIQEQDRTLELRLRQLDTEQQALSTEMEAVKKVIDKNIESTFKTFAN